MKRVFVSYSRNNLDVVSQLVQDMQAVGVQAWHDQTLTGGQRWWDNILENIRDCDVFVFALSPESWESEACRSELAYVGHFGKAVLPVLVADGINLNLLPPPISEIQVTDYRRRDKNAAFALIKSINTAPFAPPLPDPLPSPPKVPVSYLSTLKERIDSPNALSAQDQIALIFELETGVREGRPRSEMRDLLLSLKRRDDLLAKIAVRIDEMLNTLEAPVAPPRVAPPVATSLAPAAPLLARFVPQATAWKVTNSQTRRYACAPGDVPKVIADVKTFLDTEGFDSQQLKTEDAGVLLQIKKRGSWRDFVGMATSLNIVFRQAEGMMTVEIGAGKWLDASVGTTATLILLWPLAVTAGLGAWEQMKLPEKIFGFIGNRLAYR